MTSKAEGSLILVDCILHFLHEISEKRAALKHSNGSAVLHDWTFLATCLRSGRRFLGMGLDEWLILSARELLCDCVWLLEIGDV